MSDERKITNPDEQEPEKTPIPEQDKKPEGDETVLYDASELSDDDLEGAYNDEVEDADGAGVFFVPVFIAANVNVVANVNVGANLNAAANASAAVNVVLAANVNATANANAITNANVTD